MKKFAKSLWQTLTYALPSHTLIDRWMISAHYFHAHKRLPNLVNPARNTEKIQRRKLYDRNPLLPILQDKLTARDYVAERIGADYLVPLYFSGTDANDLNFDHLPESFVLKPNHGSGWGILVEDKSQLDVVKARQQIRRWLTTNYYRIHREWAYKDIPPAIMVEKFLHDNGQTHGVPTDYTILCFDGLPRILSGVTGRYNPGDMYSMRYEICDDTLVPLNYDTLVGSKRYRLNNLPPEQAIDPASLKEMLAVCRRISAGIDALRVDLYQSDNRLYFGEIALYPGSGFFRYRPDHFDAYVGRFWQQPY